MHELITAVGSLLIISLFISQFAANENLYLETVEIKHTVERYLEEEYDEDEIPMKMDELVKDLNGIPNTSARRTREGVDITISGVIGPDGALGISDNTIKINKRIDLKLKEDTNEESDNNGGTPDIDGTSEPVSDGYESDSAIGNLVQEQEDLGHE